MARFKVALRRYLSAHSVYSVDEFLYVYRWPIILTYTTI
jgi:hypothetical protein